MAKTTREIFDDLLADAGLDDTTKAALYAVADKDTVKARASRYRAADEVDTEIAALNQYKKWVEENNPSIQQMQTEYAKYVERYGAIGDNVQQQQNSGGGLTKEQLEAEIKRSLAQFGDQFGNRMTEILKDTGKVVSRHTRSGFNKDLDMDEISKLAIARNLSLEGAYNEWIRPDVEAKSKVDTEAEIKRRVDAQVAEERAKMNDSWAMPSTELNQGARGLSRRNSEEKTYNRDAVVRTFMTGQYDGVKQ